MGNIFLCACLKRGYIISLFEKRCFSNLPEVLLIKNLCAHLKWVPAN